MRHGAHLFEIEFSRFFVFGDWGFTPSVCAEQRSKTGISETHV